MRGTLSVLIPDGEAAVALHVARCLTQTSKVTVYILSNRHWTWCRFSRHRRVYEFRLMGADDQARFETVVGLVKRFNIDLILPVSQDGVEFVITRRQALSEVAKISPVPDLEAFNIAKDKWLLTQFASEKNLPVPLSMLATRDSTFYQQLSRLEYPVVLKPRLGYGGKGIQQFNTMSDLQRFLDGQKAEQFEEQYLLQNYLPGSDLGLSVLCHQGQILAFTIQQGLMAENLGPLKAMQFVDNQDVLEIGQKLLSALNWTGVAHIDMRFDENDGKVKILEVNPRFWNSLPGSLVVGVNFPYLACLTALEVPFPRPHYGLGKYLHLGTAAKEIILRFFGRNRIKDFTFEETGLKFFLTDPIPDVINLIAKRIRRFRRRRLNLPNKMGFLDRFLADWFPDHLPRSHEMQQPEKL